MLYSIPLHEIIHLLTAIAAPVEPNSVTAVPPAGRHAPAPNGTKPFFSAAQTTLSIGEQLKQESLAQMPLQPLFELFVSIASIAADGFFIMVRDEARAVRSSCRSLGWSARIARCCSIDNAR